MVLLVALAMFGVFFFISLYMQNVLGYCAVQAGAAFLPMTLLIILVAPIAGRLSDRLGSRWLMAAGMMLVSARSCCSSRSSTATRRTSTCCPAMLARRGRHGDHDDADAPRPRSARFPVDKAGVGSAVLNTFRQVGGSLGIALMGAIMAAASTVGERTPEQRSCDGLHHALYVAAGDRVRRRRRRRRARPVAPGQGGRGVAERHRGRVSAVPADAPRGT